MEVKISASLTLSWCWLFIPSLFMKRDMGWRGTLKLSVFRLRQCRDGCPPGKRGTIVEKNSRVKRRSLEVQGWVTSLEEGCLIGEEFHG